MAKFHLYADRFSVQSADLFQVVRFLRNIQSADLFQVVRFLRNIQSADLFQVVKIPRVIGTCVYSPGALLAAYIRLFGICEAE